MRAFPFRLWPLLSLLLSVPLLCQGSNDAGWPTYGGDPGGQRFTSATEIDRTDIGQLRPVWTFHTGALRSPGNAGRAGSFETTPILFRGALYLTSPFDGVYAVDPATGALRWSYEPRLDWSRNLGIVTSRGVASWPASPSPAALAAACESRIFLGTLDARLIALDAATGRPCPGFGQDGAVDLTAGVDYRKGDNYSVTSPPTVVGDVVVVGSGIADNARVDTELGVVRGFDARSGRLLWSWDPIPWAKGQTLRTGSANTWSVISADLEHGIVYLPTSSPSPDYYGGSRPGDNRDADSVVALDARTGRKIWAFQVVHHDLWDYDIAAEPLLFTFRGSTPAVAVATKMGLVFVFNRLTGEPLYKITERPVPPSDIPGEVISPTQPFPDLPPLSPLTLDLTGPLGITPETDAACRTILSGLRYDGIYTPASVRGSVLFPSNVGGVNWGSAALDPATGILYANTNHAPFLVTLRKRPLLSPPVTAALILILTVTVFLLIVGLGWKFGRGAGLLGTLALLLVCLGVAYKFRYAIRPHLKRSVWLDSGATFTSHFGKEYGEDAGIPYVMTRQPLDSKTGFPCSPTPWGTISALNLNTGQSVWQTPLGTMVPGQHTGAVNVGGPMVTAGGLVFTAATGDTVFRAFDSATGVQVWHADLPAPAQATPMSYVLNGRQYIVLAAGGHAAFGTERSDAVIAYALPARR